METSEVRNVTYTLEVQGELFVIENARAGKSGMKLCLCHKAFAAARRWLKPPAATQSALETHSIYRCAACWQPVLTGFV